jgi:anthranilate/para-aminobenzoate synthase component I
VYGRSTYDGLQVCAFAQQVDLLQLHRLFPQRYPFLLQSTVARPPLGRYDILFAFPGESLALEGSGRLTGRHASDARGFLGALDAWWRSEKRDGPLPDLPFHGGWFVYLGYELATEIEPVLDLPADDMLPAALAVRCRAASPGLYLVRRRHAGRARASPRQGLGGAPPGAAASPRHALAGA